MTPMHEHDDDEQGFLIRQAIAHAQDGDYFKISAAMVNALIADRQSLIDANASEIKYSTAVVGLMRKL